MAIIQDPNKQDQESGQLGSQASGTISSGGAGSPAASTSAPQTKGSGNFVSLGRYMTANQGNEAVENSVGDINKVGDQAQAGFNSAGDAFNKLSVTDPQGLSAQNQTFLDKKSNIPGQQSFAAQRSYGGDMDTGLAAARSNIDSIKYSGPSASDIGTASANYSTAKSGLDSASKMFEASPDGGGRRRQSLVDTNSQRSGGNYGAGAGNLDSLLVESRGQSAFNPQRQALSQLAGGYDANAMGARTTDLQTRATNAATSAGQMHDKAQGQYDKIKSMWDTTSATRNASQAAGPQAPSGYTGTYANPAAKVVAAPAPTPAPVYSSNADKDKNDRTK